MGNMGLMGMTPPPMYGYMPQGYAYQPQPGMGAETTIQLVAGFINAAAAAENKNKVLKNAAAASDATISTLQAMVNSLIQERRHFNHDKDRADAAEAKIEELEAKIEELEDAARKGDKK